MSRRQKCWLLFGIVVMLGLFKKGGKMFTDSTYASLVYYLGYLFLAFDELSRINVMSLHRERSLVTMYVRYMKKQVIYVAIYESIYVVIGILSRGIGQFMQDTVLLSTGALIKFCILSYMNLLLLVYIQLIIRIACGKWISLIVTSCSIFISMVFLITGGRLKTPFVFFSAYYRWRVVASYQTVLCYLSCIIIIVILTYLLRKKDKILSQ